MESRQIVGLRQSVAKKNSPEWTFWTKTDRPIFMKKGKGNCDETDCRGMSEFLSAPPATVDQLKRNHEI